MILSYLLMGGYPVTDEAKFVDLESPADWQFHPALTAQLQFHDGSDGTSFMQFQVRGGPERHGGAPAYVAVPLRYTLDGGWRLERQEGPAQFRLELGAGFAAGTLTFQPHTWDNWFVWGLDAYTTPSLALGTGKIRAVIALQLDASLVPTRLSGQVGLDLQNRWEWLVFGTSATVLAGIEWGSAPAKKERAGQ